jgi:hypothetical protein
MKKILLFVIVLSFTLFSCGKKETATDTKKEEKKAFSECTYLPDGYDSDVHLAKEVVLKGTDSAVYSLYADYKKSKLEKETGKLKDFPIQERVYDAERGIDLMMLLPNGIYIEIGNNHPKHLIRYRNLEQMKKMLLMFDLDGLSKITGDALPGGGKDLEKYFPKL